MTLALAVALVAVALHVPPPITEEQYAAAEKAAKQAACNYSPLRCFWNWTTHDPVAFYTSVLALFTGILGGSTLGLWYYTKRAADVAQQSLTELERAYVGFRLHLRFIGVDRRLGRMQFVVEWENTGRTPTKGLYSRVNWGHFGAELPDSFTFPDDAPPEPGFISPQDKIVEAPIEIDAALLDAAWQGFIHIYVWGWAEYDDIFPGTRAHRTEFCNELLITRDPNIIYGDVLQTVRMHIIGRHVGVDGECYRQARHRRLRTQPYA